MKKPARISQGSCSKHAAQHGQPEPAPGPGLQRRGRPEQTVLARKTAADQPAEIERIRGQQVEHAEKNLHPDQAAQQMSGGDQGDEQEPHVAARAQDGGSQQQGRSPVGQRPGERQGKLARRPVGIFLALGVGVGKKPADGQQQNGAQAQSKPRRNQQPGGFAHHDGGHQQNRNSARPRGHPSAPLMANNTRSSSGKKMWTRISTPIHRPSGIDQPRIHAIVEVRAQAGAKSLAVLAYRKRLWASVPELGQEVCFMLVVDAHHCGIVSFARARAPAGDGHAAHQRPPARDALQRACAAHRRAPRFSISMPVRARWALRR